MINTAELNNHCVRISVFYAENIDLKILIKFRLIINRNMKKLYETAKLVYEMYFKVFINLNFDNISLQEI